MGLDNDDGKGRDEENVQNVKQKQARKDWGEPYMMQTSGNHQDIFMSLIEQKMGASLPKRYTIITQRQRLAVLQNIL